MGIEAALARAAEEGMDLVEIAPQAKPPVCRIMDWGKYRFEQSKRAQAARRRQKQIQVKEVKIRPGTDDHDYDVKMRKLSGLIVEGNKVRLAVRCRGRKMAHNGLGRDLLNRVGGDMHDEVAVEQRPRMEGRQMVIMLAPRRGS